MKFNIYIYIYIFKFVTPNIEIKERKNQIAKNTPPPTELAYIQVYIEIREIHRRYNIHILGRHNGNETETIKIAYA
jgi:hypothetical protein